METDFKITRSSDTETIVRIYEGETAAANETGIDGVVRSITRYRRSRLLRQVTLSGTRSEAEAAAKQLLADDGARTVIPEQRL